MDNLFELWAEKIPNYGSNYKSLFDSISRTGALGGDKASLGKHFNTNYELYIYAFFLGLYNDNRLPISQATKKVNFSHHIKFWGRTKDVLRKDFTKLQKNIFVALVTKTDIDFIALDKGDLPAEKVIRELIITMEEYTNGGLSIIQDKIQKAPNFILKPDAFIELL